MHPYHAGMHLCAMHDARTLSALLGLPAPPLCEWMASPLANPGEPLGCFARGNLLQPDFAFDAELPGRWIFAWSGTLAGSLSEKSPLNWMRGPAVLAEACESLRPQLVRHGRRLVLVPHARHVLSDARSALVWWSEQVIPGQELRADTRAPQGDRPFGLALDLAALLEPEMVADVADHVQSWLRAMAPRADALVVRGVRPGADGEGMEPCTLAEGVLPVDLVRRLAAELAPDVPVLVPGRDVGHAQAMRRAAVVGGTRGCDHGCEQGGEVDFRNS